ncbi:bifunctional metallophosphatase/5'-nucleotidase [Corynebacterium kutscheri]|uniref:bifunctional metallophosphatase/5'-nucleotidase n=1 Tax=Corynebacterium kutscheri TaxID=35755 RepID=UPI0037BFB4C0
MSRSLIAFVASVALATSMTPALSAQEVKQTAERKFNITNITDFHGHIEANDKDPGAIALKCALDKAADGLPTIITSSGDNVGGTPFFSAVLNDKPTIDIFNAMGVRVSALGNHEFDKGAEDVKTRIIPESKFVTLGVNVTGLGDGLKDYYIEDFSGVKVAFIGTVTDTTDDLVAGDAVKGITFTNPITRTNELADELKKSNKADVIVSLIHEGLTGAETWSENVDIVFAGHTHQVIQAQPGKQPLIMQAGEYGRALADVNLTFDAATKKLTIDEAQVIEAEEIKKCTTPNAAIQKIIDEARPQVEAKGNEVVSHSQVSFYRGKNEGGDSGTNRGVESQLNNLLADAAKWAITQNTGAKANIGVMNAGGVRADLEKGDITYAKAFAVQPFGNDITYTKLSGAKFKEALEQQWKGDAESRPVLSLGVSDNVSYTYDPARSQGDRITSVTIDGEPLDMNKEYVVAGATFLLGGGDSFTALSQGTPLAQTGYVDVQAFIDYLKEHKNLQGRAGQSNIAITPRGSWKAGEKITLDLASLKYTQGDDSSMVTVSLGEAKVEAPINPTLGAPGYGEAGTATVELAIPAGLTGQQQLVVTTDGGTHISLPVTIDGSTDPQNPKLPGSSTGSVIIGTLAVIGGLLAVIAGPLRQQLVDLLARFNIRLPF